jgi:phosphoglycerate kinase
MNKKTIRDFDPAGKRVLVRVDFNVPLEHGTVSDDSRIRASLPTIQYLIDRQAKVILCSHLGRPKGKPVPGLSLRPAACRLGELLHQSVCLAPDCVGPAVTALVGDMKLGQVVLLENLRFHPEEEANDPKFAQQLAAAGELFVNDAFGSVHRAHASTAGVARYLPAVAGLLLERELDVLGRVLSNPDRPFIAILGGAKVSDKIGVIKSLLDRADTLLIGGGMANTFLKATGKAMGDSLVEDAKVAVARELLGQGKRKLLLPEDLVIAESLEAPLGRVVGVDEVPAGWIALDIGPKTVASFRERLRGSRTIVWNGPMGVFEKPPFARGTISIAQAVSEVTGAATVVGGGDTIAAVKAAHVETRITHISTGGGACLEFLEGKELPGVAVLLESRS